MTSGSNHRFIIEIRNLSVFSIVIDLILIPTAKELPTLDESTKQVSRMMTDDSDGQSSSDEDEEEDEDTTVQ